MTRLGMSFQYPLRNIGEEYVESPRAREGVPGRRTENRRETSKDPSNAIVGVLCLRLLRFRVSKRHMVSRSIIF